MLIAIEMIMFSLASIKTFALLCNMMYNIDTA